MDWGDLEILWHVVTCTSRESECDDYTTEHGEVLRSKCTRDALCWEERITLGEEMTQGGSGGLVVG